MGCSECCVELKTLHSVSQIGLTDYNAVCVSETSQLSNVPDANWRRAAIRRLPWRSERTGMLLCFLG